MSNLVVNDVKFPVGTVVSAYPAAAVHHGQAFAAAVDSATVQADGTLTLTGLTDGVSYQVGATVGGSFKHFKLVKSSAFVAAVKWKDKVAARRAAIGTS